MSDKESKKLQRRALVKAVAAAPVVFTLPSGAALATTSLTCADKSKLQAVPAPANIKTNETDKWVRYRVQKKKFKVAGSGPSSFLFGFELNGTLYYGNGAQVTGTVTDLTTVNGQYYYLLLDYDAYKNGSSVIASAYPADNSISNPIAGGSCWASLTGETPHPGNILF